MADQEKLIRTISNIRFDGKWLELWFEEGPEEFSFGDCHLSCKADDLWNAIYNQDLYTSVIASGVLKRKVELERIGGNWTIAKFVIPVPQL